MCFLKFQFTYKTDGNQMTFLQLLSANAEQNMTYHCFNSAAHYDAQKRSYRSALKLMSWNDLELTARGTRRTRYTVVDDECRVSSFKDSHYFSQCIKYEIIYNYM